MSKRILIDASNAEETRIAVTANGKLDDFEIEAGKKNVAKGDVYLAKITRVEPSLQAAFVDFGSNRNGFLPLTEIHPDYFKIPIADQEKLSKLLKNIQSIEVDEEVQKLDADESSSEVNQKLEQADESKDLDQDARPLIKKNISVLLLVNFLKKYNKHGSYHNIKI